MNKRLRIATPVVLFYLGASLILGGCTPEPAPAPPPASPTRVAFTGAQPVRLVLLATPGADGAKVEIAWLDHELRRLLRRGGLQPTPIAPRADHADASSDAFTLRIALSADATQASGALIAPDHVLEREETFAVAAPSRLAIVQALAMSLPAFLGLQAPTSDWREFIGTDDAKRYEALTRMTSAILGPEGRGFTRPPTTAAHTRLVEQLERMVRAQPRFARARALLAVGYLSLGGEDGASLTQLAESHAKRALAQDAMLTAAHAALGLVALRRNEWVGAHEQFEAAITLDPDSAPALEGLACLLADAGRYEAAQSIARRAVALQPGSIGANECLAYAISDDGRAQSQTQTQNGPVDDQVLALKAILDKDVAKADALLREALSPQQFELWARPVLRAAGDPRLIPTALRSVTRAANDQRIDGATEILCGVALKQSEFVFNRINRLQRGRAHAPLRLLWAPQTAFLRAHARFEDVVSAAGLPAFWQEYGAPDVCSKEPKTYGCRLHATSK